MVLKKQFPKRLLVLNGVFTGVYWVGSLLFFESLPDRIPAHFTLSGEPTRFTEETAIYWFLGPFITTILVLMIATIARWMKRAPMKFMNAPYKEKLPELPADQREALELQIRITAGAVLHLSALWIILIFSGISVYQWTIAASGSGFQLWLYQLFIAVAFVAVVMFLLAELKRTLKHATSKPNTD
ncbi:MAG: DUF1648 domain-containing protein [Balneolaceae bacterium]